MEKQTKLKAIILSIAMVSGLLTVGHAQSDGFFRGSMESYENRDAGINSNDGTGITNYGIGEQVSLGSGLLILAAAGAGYAALRRKRNKKGFVMIIALAMIVTMSNCKKKVETINSVAENGVKITLTVDGGSKVIVDPTGHTNPDYATVTFESGDVIYVGNNGHYCGYLVHNGSYFTGNIDDSDLSEADYLHFYFMGNKGTNSQPSSVSIADQTAKYPVISYAHSKQLYNGAGSYTAKLENYCAIVKFTTMDIDADITITDMNNTVSVNFGANNAADGTGIGHNPYTPRKTGEGDITLHKVSNTERWAILLKQDDEVSTATAYATCNTYAYVSTSTFTVPVIDNNMYYTNNGFGISIGSMEVYVPYINAEFTVYTDRKVKFSRGNLQYNRSTGKFSFIDHQYSIVETPGQNVGRNYANQNIVSLFGWGTSGKNYHPYYTIEYLQYYPSGNSDITDTDNDWGVYNKQSNRNRIKVGCNYEWRTLTKDEWVYLFDTRSTTSSHRYAKATVCDVCGIILLPDNWDDDTYTLTDYNNANAAFTCNSIDATGWYTLEAAGCVFLPAASSRKYEFIGNFTDRVCYWSSTCKTSSNAYYVYFNNSEGHTDLSTAKYNGNSVRLVFTSSGE